MKFNMKYLTKKRIINILITIILCIVIPRIENYRYEFKGIMYRDFRNFGTELENLNEKVLKKLVFKDTTMEEEFINSKIAHSFINNNSIISRYSSDYDGFEEMYDYKINGTIENILYDGKITDSEEKYLSLLYSYNNELIKEHNNLLDKYNASNTMFNKRSLKIYEEFSSKAESLLNTSKYRFLQDYVGEYKKEDIEEAKRYCEEIFAKVVKNKDLKYSKDLSADPYMYIYETKVQVDRVIEDNEDYVEYNVEFYNRTGSMNIEAVAYSVLESTNLIDKEKVIKKLDNKAKKIVSKFSNDLINYERKVIYDGKNIECIKYSYIEEDKGIYDEMKGIELVLEIDGLVSSFSIVYPNNKELVTPKLSKDDILEKIDEKAEIKDIFPIRNVENEIEYEVHLKYKDDMYAAVFDGNEGNLKYYGKEIRNYNQNKE
ncbi:MAG: hypothetical protein KZY61_02965 [Clostridiaceae bacterium]|nr:hypothetical protein [Clostridiaceae bacterium]MBW4860995.1 hypothetical protein [Clostridiaceae bacterium]MBW4867620.1 hypothetical protein [Clostridiaceae bacterium]